MDNMEEKKENLIQVDLREIMETSFLDYSMSVIVQRALPDVRIPSVPYWAATIRTAMLRFMTRWCVLRRIFPCAICSLTATATSVP